MASFDNLTSLGSPKPDELLDDVPSPHKGTRQGGFHLRRENSASKKSSELDHVHPTAEKVKSRIARIRNKLNPLTARKMKQEKVSVGAKDKAEVSTDRENQEGGERGGDLDEDQSNPKQEEVDLWDWNERAGSDRSSPPPDADTMGSFLSATPKKAAGLTLSDGDNNVFPYAEPSSLDSFLSEFTPERSSKSDATSQQSGASTFSDSSRTPGAGKQPPIPGGTKLVRKVATLPGGSPLSNHPNHYSRLAQNHKTRDQGPIVETVTDKIHRIRRKLNPLSNKARWRYRIDEHDDDKGEESDTVRERTFSAADDDSMLLEGNEDDQSGDSVTPNGSASEFDFSSFGNRSDASILRNRREPRDEINGETGKCSSVNLTVTDNNSFVPENEGVAIRNMYNGREFRVKPYHVFLPKRVYMTEEEIYDDMLKPSEKAEFLQSFIVSATPCRSKRVTDKEKQMWGVPDDGRIGSMRVEVLGCIGISKHKPDTCVYLVCGDCAFATDVLHGSRSPMWPSKSKRTAVFPIHHAYAELFVGVFDLLPKKSDNDEFCGRVTLGISALRPNSEYDVTLPLRASNSIYDRRPRGVVRLRFSLHWFSERAAVCSYFRTPRITSTASLCADVPSIPCGDPKTFRNIAVTVHGQDLPGKYSRKAFQATMREFNLYQSNSRLVAVSLIKDAMGYENPLLSICMLISWMHCVIANSVRLVPVYFVGLLIMLMLQNYVHYVLSEQRHLGFSPVTLSEIVSAVVSESDSGCIAPLMAKKKARIAPVARGALKRQQETSTERKRSTERNICDVELLHHREFPFSEKTAYPKIAVEDSLVQRGSAKRETHQMNMVGLLSIYVKESDGTDEDTDRPSKYGHEVAVMADEENENEDDETHLLEEHDDMDNVLGLDENESDDHQNDEAESVSLSTFLAASSLKRQVVVGPPQDADIRPKKRTPPQVHLARIEDKFHKFTQSISMDRVYSATLSLRRHDKSCESHIEENQDSAKSSVLPETNTDKKRRLPLDDFDKRLGLRARHPNPVVEITSSFLGPLMRILRVLCFLFRVCFNMTTWKDPYLSFWCLCFLILLALLLLIFPWRLFFGITGLILFGPQNIFLKSRMENMIKTRGEASAVRKQEDDIDQSENINDTPLSANMEEPQAAKPQKLGARRLLQRRIDVITHLNFKKRNKNESGDFAHGSVANTNNLSGPTKGPALDRPAFTTSTIARGKKSFASREVVVPYSRFHKERFYDFPPDPTVSRCTVIAFDDGKVLDHVALADGEQN